MYLGMSASFHHSTDEWGGRESTSATRESLQKTKRADRIAIIGALQVSPASLD
jgi:hypothetical protein